MYRIAWMPGDGIGIEVMNAARVVLNALKLDAQYIDADIDTENHSTGDNFVPLNEMEKRMIMSALERFNDNRRLAAKALNISERTLYRKIKEYGLD